MRSTRPAARRPAKRYSALTPTARASNSVVRLWFSKGRQPKYYQTPYGEVEIERHVYQRSHGGKTFCPTGSVMGASW